MEIDVNEGEQVNPEFEQRLRTYYHSSYGEPEEDIAVWQNIAEQLGEQNSGKPASTDTSNRVTASSISTDKRKEPVVRLGGNRRLWTPAVAATLLLTLGGVIIALLAIVPRFAGSEEKLLFQEGFENGLADWIVVSNLSGQYVAEVDNLTVYEGKSSAYLESATGEPTSSAWLRREFDATKFRNKRIRFSAYIKTSADDMMAALSMFVAGQPMPGEGQAIDRVRLLGLDTMSDRLVLGKVDWQQHDIVLEVPADATTISITLLGSGEGRVWFDSIQLGVADGNLPVTNVYRFTEPRNTTFEQGLSAWGIMSDRPYAFEIGTDTSTVYEGEASGVISSTLDVKAREDALHLSQVVRTDNFKGKKVRFSAYIKTEAVQDRALLFIETRDLAGAPMRPGTRGSAEVSGTTDWQRYEFVIDMPEDSLFFIMSAGLKGSGKVWIDNIQLEVIGVIHENVPAPMATPTPSR